MGERELLCKQKYLRYSVFSPQKLSLHRQLPPLIFPLTGEGRKLQTTATLVRLRYRPDGQIKPIKAHFRNSAAASAANGAADCLTSCVFMLQNTLTTNTTSLSFSVRLKLHEKSLKRTRQMAHRQANKKKKKRRVLPTFSCKQM